MENKQYSQSRNTDIHAKRNLVMTFIATFIEDQSGATAIEYGLIAALVSVAAIGAMGAMGNSLGNIFTEVSSKLDDSIAP